ncbi:hypothetical protein FS837_012048 [Tulasnella sp. UAMH 9824]|nr:hypothetical protein FS837_012048 [Tulasnella sp. UAMH 9824]
MNFICRILLSWMLFICLVVPTTCDVGVIKTLLAFIPLLLCAVTTTYLVQDIIRAQSSPDTYFEFEATLYDSVYWVQSSALATADAPTLTALSSGAIDRPGLPTWYSLFGRLPASAFLAVPFAIAIGAWLWNYHTAVSDRPTTPFHPLNPKPSRLLNVFKACRYDAAPLEPATPPTTFSRPSPTPCWPPSNRSDHGTTTADLTRIFPDRLPALALLPQVENGPSTPSAPQCNVSLHRPHLANQVAVFPTIEEEDDDDEEIRSDAEDHERVQVKALTQGYAFDPSRLGCGDEEMRNGAQTSTSASTETPLSRPLIPFGQLNPNIELLQLDAVPFPSFSDDDDQVQDRPLPPLPPSVRPRTTSSRPQSPPLTIWRNREAEVMWMLLFPPLPTLAEVDEEEEHHANTTDQKLSSRRRAVMGRRQVGFSHLVQVRAVPVMKWDIMARRKFLSCWEERQVRREYRRWAPLLVFDEEPDKWTSLRPEPADEEPRRRAHKKYKGTINLELQIAPVLVSGLGLEPEEAEEEEFESMSVAAPIMGMPIPMRVPVPQYHELRDEIKSRHEWGLELAPQGHWVTPVEVKRGNRLRRMVAKISPVRAVKRLFKR